MTVAPKPPPFAIFRARDAVDFEKSGLMSSAPPTKIEAEGGAALVEAGVLDGTRSKLLFQRPGMSLTHVWFQSGFPLPRHAHNTDCLYFVVAGSLRIGTEQLRAGDGFFVAADVPYTYVAGQGGVEVLEFRGSNEFDIKLMANNASFWAQALEKLPGQRESWASETSPSGLTFRESSHG